MDDVVEIHMRVLPEDLRTYLNSSAEPLGILKVVNTAPSQNWGFQIKLNENMSPEITVKLPESISPWSLLDGTIPELHWCTKILVRCRGFDYEIDPYSSAIGEVKKAIIDLNEIILTDFGGNYLNPIWGELDEIQKYLTRYTWFGVPLKNRKQSLLTWRYMADEYFFESARLMHTAKLGECLSFQSNNFIIDIYERPGHKETEIMESVYGDFLNRQEYRPLVEAVKRKGVSGSLIVLSKGWKFDMGPLGAIRSLERTEQIVQSFKFQIVDSEKFQGWVEKRRERKKMGEAARLSTRLEHARNAAQVFYKDKLIGTVPTSEAGAAAIFHKLEALGGVPFPRFNTIAWASSDGIDAIADIQFELNEPVGHLLPIEYEFKFDNFITHQHPHEHVYLVVCWSNSNLLTKTSKSWIFTYKHAKFKVLIISEVPHLKIVTRV